MTARNSASARSHGPYAGAVGAKVLECLEREDRQTLVERPHLCSDRLQHCLRRFPPRGVEPNVEVHVAAILPPERDVDMRRRLLVEDFVAPTARPAVRSASA